MGEAVGVAAGTGPAARVGVGVEVGEFAGTPVGCSLMAGTAVAAGVDVRTCSGAAVSSSPPPQLVATSPPAINIKSKIEPDRMSRIITVLKTSRHVGVRRGTGPGCSCTSQEREGRQRDGPTIRGG